MNLRKRNLVKKIGSILLVLSLITACIPPTEEVYHEVNIDYDDPGIRKIIDLEVRQDIDSLMLFTSDPNPAYRYFAANAFASIQTIEAFDTLVQLLEDPFIEVKTAAAFALGQLRDGRATTHLVEAFRQQDSIDVNNTFNATVLEAMGKVGGEEFLEAIATVSTYRNTDTLLLKGQVNGIYQYGLRDIFNPAADKTMIRYLTEEYPLSVKKMAAQYFFRFEEATIEDAKFQLLKLMQEHPDPDIRMALVTALVRKGDPELQSQLFSFYNSEKDYRVKCNFIRQIQKYPYIAVVEKMLAEINNPNQKIALSAADYLLNNGNGYDAPVYRQYIRADQPSAVQIRMHQAILRNSGTYSGSRSASTNALKSMYPNLGNYEKAAALNALSEDPRNYEFLIEKYKSEEIAVIQTSAIVGLGKMLRNERFYAIMGNAGGNNAKNVIATHIREVMENGEGGAVAAAASLFADDDLNFEQEFESLAFLENTLSRLKLPDELETYNELNASIAKSKGNSAPEPKTSDNIKEVNWSLFDQYSSNPKIRINTTKGEIEIILDKEKAPQSVMSTIELIKNGYYNNKFFHRVVPNFVAQAGCPQGDGYGSLNFTIRSELNNVHYNDEGYLGYASAGPHTESSQWFITYCPTPHLNGKYTIIGKVSNGMENVHLLEVGDKINRISISN